MSHKNARCVFYFTSFREEEKTILEGETESERENDNYNDYAPN